MSEKAIGYFFNPKTRKFDIRREFKDKKTLIASLTPYKPIRANKVRNINYLAD